MLARGGRLAALGRGAVLASVVASLFFASSALAGERFAEVGGDGPSPCTFADRCSIQDAVSGAQSGDTVYLASGTYSLATTVELPVGASLSGIAGGVTISSTASTAVRVPASSSSSVVRDITINHAPSSGSQTAGLELLAGNAFNLIVTSSGDSACVVTGGITTPLLQTSVCHNTSPSIRTAINSYSAVDSTARVLGVTAVSDAGYGMYVNATAPSADVNLIADNVIAQGFVADIGGFNSSSTSTSSNISLSFSNFGSYSFNSGSSGTEPTVNSNQTAEPLLDSNFRQLAGSPTINAGGFFAEQNTLDIDYSNRPAGAAIDIGAYEAEGDAPDTLINSKPPKRTSKRVAKFKFGSTDLGSPTFECKIDAKPFKPCTSPIAYRNLKRGKRHTFQVRATDGFFNTDATPAKYTWKVLK